MTTKDDLHKIDATISNLRTLLRLAQFSIREITGGCDSSIKTGTNAARSEACDIEAVIKAYLIRKAIGLGDADLADKLREILSYHIQLEDTESCDGPT